MNETIWILAFSIQLCDRHGFFYFLLAFAFCLTILITNHIVNVLKIDKSTNTKNKQLNVLNEKFRYRKDSVFSDRFCVNINIIRFVAKKNSYLFIDCRSNVLSIFFALLFNPYESFSLSHAMEMLKETRNNNNTSNNYHNKNNVETHLDTYLI